MRLGSLIFLQQGDVCMKHEQSTETGQPPPFTPGLDKAAVRQHAMRLYRDKLRHHGLTLEDWILAEKDLVTQMQTENVGMR
jgi:hypothetical protein